MTTPEERDCIEWEEGWAQKEELTILLRAHAAAWWGDIGAADYVENVNATYADYLAAGGDDAHWQVISGDVMRLTQSTKKIEKEETGIVNQWHIQQGQQSEARQLFSEADELHRRLNNTAYTILAAYSRSAYGHHAYDDPRIVRLNRIIGKAANRVARRWARWDELIRAAYA